MSNIHTARILAGILTCFILLLATPSFAAKTDIVEMRNGDHLTGEIKNLERGILSFSTDHMGTISIEWEEVASVKSDQVLEIELTSGQRFFGHIAADTNPGMLLVTGAEDNADELSIEDTIRMSPLEESGNLRDRIDSYVDFGFSDTKANDLSQYSFDAGFSYRDRKSKWDLRLSTIQSDSGDGRAGSSTLRGSRQRFFGNRWFWSGLLQLDQNDEQGLDLRTLAGGGLGRNLVQTNKQYFAVSGGFGLTREDLDDGTDTDSVEAILGVGYDVFSFANPDLDLHTELVVFPSLTVSGRVRTQAEISLSYEIIDDLYIELSLQEYYDSEPQSAGAEKNDYAITTSLGYSF
jgi:putative salt-induced outer membrane protein YdiY